MGDSLLIIIGGGGGGAAGAADTRTDGGEWSGALLGGEFLLMFSLCDDNSLGGEYCLFCLLGAWLPSLRVDEESVLELSVNSFDKCISIWWGLWEQNIVDGIISCFYDFKVITSSTFSAFLANGIILLHVRLIIWSVAFHAWIMSRILPITISIASIVCWLGRWVTINGHCCLQNKDLWYFPFRMIIKSLWKSIH